MTAHPFLTDAARQAARQAVVDIESRTSAEVIVAVRRASGRYREADDLGGCVVGLLVLLGLLYLPPIFPLWTFVPNLVIGFVLGAWLVSRSTWLRRRLTPEHVLVEHTRTAARASFVDAGYSRLPARQAVLVYVALLERHADVVADLGLEDVTRQAEWTAACQRLDATMRPPDVERFVSALRELGHVLAAAHPRLKDDRNELADEVQAS